jgi:hypothetical protein
VALFVLLKRKRKRNASSVEEPEVESSHPAEPKRDPTAEPKRDLTAETTQEFNPYPGPGDRQD